jgi:hypothetical protein
MSNDRLYLSFGVSFLSDGSWLNVDHGTNAFVWMRSLKAEMFRKPMASLSGFAADRRALESFCGDPAPPFLRVMSSSVYDASASIPMDKLPNMIHGVYAPTGWH